MRFKDLHMFVLETTANAKGVYGPVYHGTGAKLDGKLTVAKSGSKTDWGLLGQGLYFTSSKGAAKGWSRGGIVITANIKMKKPFIYDNESAKEMRKNGDKWLQLKHDGDAKGMTDYLKSKGYDGVIAPEMDEYVVFSDDQVIEIERS